MNNKPIRLDDALTEVMHRRASAEPQLPADFSQRVADAMMARRRKARLRTIVGWSTFGAVAAAVLLVFLLIREPAIFTEGRRLAGSPSKVEGVPRKGGGRTSTSYDLNKQSGEFADVNHHTPQSLHDSSPILREQLVTKLDYSKLAPGVYLEIDEEGDTVYVVITNQRVPAPTTRPVLPEVNIAERMQQAEEFGKQLRKEFDSIHLALNK